MFPWLTAFTRKIHRWHYNHPTAPGHPATASLPVILVTAHAMQGDRETFSRRLTRVVDGYISKPVVDDQAFVYLIKAMIDSGLGLSKPGPI
jgi:CheY-like chemotaxis protein